MDEYCQEELQIYYEASITHRAEMTQHWVIAIRVANNAGKRSLSQYLRKLSETGRRIDKVMGRLEVDPKQFFSSLEQMLKNNRKKKE